MRKTTAASHYPLSIPEERTLTAVPNDMGPLQIYHPTILTEPLFGLPSNYEFGVSDYIPQSTGGSPLANATDPGYHNTYAPSFDDFRYTGVENAVGSSLAWSIQHDLPIDSHPTFGAANAVHLPSVTAVTGNLYPVADVPPVAILPEVQAQLRARLVNVNGALFHGYHSHTDFLKAWNAGKKPYSEEEFSAGGIRRLKYYCLCCTRCFTGKYGRCNLRRHAREKALKEQGTFIPCKFCDKWFLRASNYHQHVVMDHGEQGHEHDAFKCHICGRRYRTQDDLLRHMEERHPWA